MYQKYFIGNENFIFISFYNKLIFIAYLYSYSIIDFSQGLFYCVVYFFLLLVCLPTCPANNNLISFENKIIKDRIWFYL